MPPTLELERLYDAYAAGLFDYLCAIVKTEAEAGDLLHDLFVKVGAQGIPSHISSEKAYLWRLAHNLAIDALRKHSRRGRLLASMAVEHGVTRQFAESIDPDADDFARRVRAAVDDLPTDQRSIAQMKLWDGLTFDEIAHAQGISANTAASRYRYAIEKLRAQLRPLYEEITP